MNQLFQFFVRASDKGSPPTFTDVPVEVYIMDSEAQPPQFEDPLYTYFVSEEKPASTIIASVSASTRNNASLLYTIVSGDSQKHNSMGTFTIKPTNGEITMVASLDREVVNMYELTVRAETRASPALVAYTQVNVQVIDVNDNSPLFEAHSYDVRMAENSEIGTEVVQARD